MASYCISQTAFYIEAYKFMVCSKKVCIEVHCWVCVTLIVLANTCIYRYLQTVLQTEPTHLKSMDIVCVDQDRMMGMADNVLQHSAITFHT